MTTSIVPGHRTWSMTRDPDGHRNYKIKYLVGATSSGDGPAKVLLTPGLPTFGSHWVVDNDYDLWAWCRWDANVTPLVSNEPNHLWEAEFTFSTKPPDARPGGGGGGGGRACKDTQIDDPLLEAPKISGSSVKYTEEAVYDRFGNAILSSSFEPLPGPQVEFDKNRPQVKIEQNVASAYQAYQLPQAFADCVNKYALWGRAARSIKLSECTWEQKFYGSCYLYYTRSLTFDVRYEGFDRDVVDVGTKALHGHWNSLGRWVLDPVGKDGFGHPVYGDATDPSHYSRFKDRNGENCKVVLNGAGLPAEVYTGSGTPIVGQPITYTGGPGSVHVAKYDEADFTLLGIPLNF